MPKSRVFSNPDGTVRIVHPVSDLQLPGESDDAFIQRVGLHAIGADPTLAGLPFIDVDQAQVLALSRKDRHKWRVDGQTIKIDFHIADLPHPKQALLDQIDASTTVAQLKVVMRTIVRG